MLKVLLVILLGAALAVGAGWCTVRRLAPAADVTPTSAPVAAPADTTPRIRVNLFYVSEDGTELVPVNREVAYAKATVDQARAILEAQLGAAPSPYLHPLPAGTTLRAVFMSEQGEAFVDLSIEASTQHAGGSLDELLTVYAVVNALTANLPSVKAVQILVNGREVDTLAGHIDLRQPLRRNLSVVRDAAEPADATPAPPQSERPETESRVESTGP